MAKGKPTPKKTSNKIEFDNQIKRIKRLIKKQRKLGNNIDESIIPQEPKRITRKKIEELQKINAKFLSSQTPKMPTTSTNKTTKKDKNVAIKKNKQSTKRVNKIKQGSYTSYIPHQADIVLTNIEEMIEHWSPQSNWTPYFSSVKSKDKNILKNILNGAINEYDRQTIARRLERNAFEAMEIVNRILYESGGKSGRDQTQLDLQRFSAIIMGRSLTVEESKKMTEVTETMELP